MTDETWGQGTQVYEALKQWFISEIYENSSSKMEADFFTFLGTDKNGKLREALASGADLSKNDKENLLDFLNGKNQPVVKSLVSHTPQTFLQLAKVFLRMGDIQLGGESIWAAFSLAVRNYGRSAQFRPRLITFQNHEQKIKFCYAAFGAATGVKLNPMIGTVIDIAKGCHECLYDPYRKDLPTLQLDHAEIEKFIDQIEGRQAGQKELKRIEPFRNV